MLRQCLGGVRCGRHCFRRRFGVNGRLSGVRCCNGRVVGWAGRGASSDEHAMSTVATMTATAATNFMAVPDGTAIGDCRARERSPTQKRRESSHELFRPATATGAATLVPCRCNRDRVHAAPYGEPATPSVGGGRRRCWSATVSLLHRLMDMRHTAVSPISSGVIRCCNHPEYFQSAGVQPHTQRRGKQGCQFSPTLII